MENYIGVYHHCAVVREEDLPVGITVESRSSVGTCTLKWDGNGILPLKRLTELFASVIPETYTKRRF